MTVTSPLISVMQRAARKAARGLVRDFGEIESLQVSRKGPADFVSAADLRAEQTLVEELQKARPGFSFLAEERGEIKGEDTKFRWIIDPLDGTTNFLHSLPYFCIAIALEETKPDNSTEIVAAYIEAPILKESFWAEKGKGAFMSSDNRDMRMRVAGRRTVDEALLATASSLKGKTTHLDTVRLLAGKSAGIRSLGSSVLDLAYTAAGKYDAFFQDGIKPWDMATGILLVKEAGGVVTDMQNGTNMLSKHSILASNDHLHAKLLKEIEAK